MHTDLTFSTLSIALMWIINPFFLSLISTAVFVMYFLSMTKINVVDKKYNGKWLEFFKSWFSQKKNN